MQRAFGRALRRAGLPVKFSEGFNPHIVMSFASPLSVGIGTKGDYLEIRLEKECAGHEIKDRLNAVLPEEIRIISAGNLAEDTPKLMSMNHSAEYRLEFERDMETAAKEFMAMDSCITRDRKGREVDIRPLVLLMKVDGKNLTVCLENSSRAALNPATLAGALGGGAVMTRLECFCLFRSKVIPMDALIQE